MPFTLSFWHLDHICSLQEFTNLGREKKRCPFFRNRCPRCVHARKFVGDGLVVRIFSQSHDWNGHLLTRGLRFCGHQCGSRNRNYQEKKGHAKPRINRSKFTTEVVLFQYTVLYSHPLDLFRNYQCKTIPKRHNIISSPIWATQSVHKQWFKSDDPLNI